MHYQQMNIRQNTKWSSLRTRKFISDDNLDMQKGNDK